MFQKKYRIILVRREYQTLNVIRSFQSNTISTIQKIGKKTFNIKIQYPTYSIKLQKVYIIDYESGNQLNFVEMKSILNPDELDMIVSTNIIKELTAGALDKKDKFLMLIFGLVIGILMGIVGMMFYMQSEIEDIYSTIPIGTVI